MSIYLHLKVCHIRSIYFITTSIYYETPLYIIVFRCPKNLFFQPPTHYPMKKCWWFPPNVPWMPTNFLHLCNNFFKNLKFLKPNFFNFEMYLLQITMPKLLSLFLLVCSYFVRATSNFSSYLYDVRMKG